MPVGQQDGVQAFQPNAEGLLAEVRRGINHHVLAATGDQQGRAQPFIVRIVRLAHATRASQGRNAHGCARAEYGDF